MYYLSIEQFVHEFVRCTSLNNILSSKSRALKTTKQLIIFFIN